jgi:hypothetical protein
LVLPPDGSKVGGFRLGHGGGGRLILRRNLPVTLLLGMGGLLVLILGVAMAIYMAQKTWADGSENRHEDRGGVKMALFLIVVGGTGTATLLGTSAWLFDAEGGFVERRRLLGLLKHRWNKSDLKSADLKLFTVPNGFVMCTLYVTGTDGKKLDCGVRYRITDNGALVLARLALWISRRFGIPYRTLMDQATSVDSVPEGELKALIV